MMKRSFILAFAALALFALPCLTSCGEDDWIDLEFFQDNFIGTWENNDGTLHAELDTYSTIVYMGTTYSGQLNPFVMESGDINISFINMSPEFPYPYITMHVDKMSRNKMTVTIQRSIEYEDGSSEDLGTTTETLYKK